MRASPLPQYQQQGSDEELRKEAVASKPKAERRVEQALVRALLVFVRMRSMFSRSA
jgi:hypothetical protein